MTGTLADPFYQYELAAACEAYPLSLFRIRVSA